jgi:hypothetical protein
MAIDQELYLMRSIMARERVVLVGGYAALLTPEEHNAWTEYVRDQPQYNALQSLEIEERNVAYAIIGGDLQMMEKRTRLEKEIEACKRQLYDIAKAWCENREVDE